MKIAMTGATGYLGKELSYIPLKCDITDEAQVKRALAEVKPDVILHLAALTDVDVCQTDHRAFKVNVLGTCNLVDNFRGPIVYVSTCQVFSGTKFFGGGYSEKHKPSPVNIYGLTKLAAETLVASRKNSKIIRTGKLFSYSTVEAVLDVIDTGGEVEVTNLIKRSFLHVNHFVEGLQWVMDNLDNVPQYLHVVGTDILSYYEFYRSLLQHYEMDASKLMARNHELKLETPRPLRAGLNVSLAKRLGVPLYSAYEGFKEL